MSCSKLRYRARGTSSTAEIHSQLLIYRQLVFVCKTETEVGCQGLGATL